MAKAKKNPAAGTLPRVGSLWVRKDQRTPELVMVMSAFVTGAIGYAPVTPNAPAFQTVDTLEIFLDRFEPFRRATVGRPVQQAVARSVPRG